MKYLLVLTVIHVVYSTTIHQNTFGVEDVLEDDLEGFEDYVETEKLEGRRYKPDWNDLDTRPLPEWYDRAKIGIFMHWGVYSVPGYCSEWLWYYLKTGDQYCNSFMKKNYPPGFTYQDFGPSFTAEFFDSKQWAEIFKQSGAKYVILTSKHHEGFTLFPSKQAFGWNSVDVGPHRDIIKELSEGVRKAGLEFGVYYSLFEWFHPLYMEDKAANHSTSKYVKTIARPDLEQLVNDYKPSIIWSDGENGADYEYWNSRDFLAWLYSDSPVKDKVVVNDRWGKGTIGKHGDFYNYEDKFNPGLLQKHKWEYATSINKVSWGYQKNIRLEDLMTNEEIINNIVKAISCGGNALINFGPTKEGTILPIFQERLLYLGKWLKINGEAIYSSSPWLHQNDSSNGHVWYTCTKTTYNATDPIAPPNAKDNVTAIYAIFLEWPEKNELKLKDITSVLKNNKHKITLLGQGSNTLNYTFQNEETLIQLPDFAKMKYHGWTLKLSLK